MPHCPPQASLHFFTPYSSWAGGWGFWSDHNSSSLLLLPQLLHGLVHGQSHGGMFAALMFLHGGCSCVPDMATPWHQHPIIAFLKIMIVFSFHYLECNELYHFVCRSGALGHLVLRTSSWCVENRTALPHTLTSVYFTHCSLPPFLLFHQQFCPL